MDHQVDSLLRIITSGSEDSADRVSRLRDFDIACRAITYDQNELGTVCGRLAAMISKWIGIDGLTVLVTPTTYWADGADVLCKYSPVELPDGRHLYDCFGEVLFFRGQDVGAFQLLATTDWVLPRKMRDLLEACMPILARVIKD
jgi:hypothetical protein